MTSTPVKDVGAVLNSLASAVGGGARTAPEKGFQTVLSGQTGRNQGEGPTADPRPDLSRQAVKKTPGDSLKAKDAHQARVSDNKPAEGKEADLETGGLTGEDLEEAMEALGTAALDMVRQIADTFGVSHQEVENAMRELGMEGLDVLDKGKLGELLLALGGAENEYALVTDGELYGNYRELLAGQEALLREAGQEAGLSREQIQEAVQALTEEPPVAESIPMEEAGPTLAQDVQPGQAQEAETPEQPQAPEQAGRQEPADRQEPDGVGVSKPGQAGEAAEEPIGNRKAGEEGGQPEAGTEKRDADPGEGGRHPAFAQNFRTETFQAQPGMQAGAAAPEAWRTDTQDIMRQIMDYMRIQVKPDTSSLEMQLHPQSLGSLHVQVASRGGVVTASFIAQNETVKAALESQIVQLQESFEQQGVKVEAIEVTVEAHAFERNLDQGRGQGGAREQEGTARRARTRRINLNDPLDREELEAEDALAAEMMAASGSQVDYTV